MRPAILLLAIALLGGACTQGPTARTPAEPPGSAPAATASPAAALTRVRQGQPSSAVQYLYLVVAQEQGFYREQGLDVELVLAPANVVLAALSAGEIDYTAGIPGGIRLALRGQPLKVVSVAALQEFTLVTGPSITAPEQLRGKAVAISAPGATSDQAVRRGLAHFGLDPSDVTAVAMGDAARQFQALQVGAVDAAALALPYSVMAQREGLRSWLRLETLYRAVNTGLVAPQSRIDGRREEVLGLIRAELAAVRFMKTNREAGAALLAQRLDLAPDLAAAVYEVALDIYVATADLEALRDAIETVIVLERAAAEFTNGKGWADLVDPGLAREAAR